MTPELSAERCAAAAAAFTPTWPPPPPKPLGPLATCPLPLTGVEEETAELKSSLVLDSLPETEGSALSSGRGVRKALLSVRLGIKSMLCVLSAVWNHGGLEFRQSKKSESEPRNCRVLRVRDNSSSSLPRLLSLPLAREVRSLCRSSSLSLLSLPRTIEPCSQKIAPESSSCPFQINRKHA